MRLRARRDDIARPCRSSISSRSLPTSRARTIASDSPTAARSLIAEESLTTIRRPRLAVAAHLFNHRAMTKRRGRGEGPIRQRRRQDVFVFWEARIVLFEDLPRRTARGFVAVVALDVQVGSEKLSDLGQV